MFLFFKINNDEKDPIGRVKSIMQDRKRTLSGLKSWSKLEGVESCISREVFWPGYMGRDAGSLVDLVMEVCEPSYCVYFLNEMMEKCVS